MMTRTEPVSCHTVRHYCYSLSSILATKQHMWVSEWAISTIRLYSAIHVDSCWIIQDRRQAKNTDTNHNPEKAHKAKHTKTKLTWFSQSTRWAYSTTLPSRHGLKPNDNPAMTSCCLLSTLYKTEAHMDLYRLSITLLCLPLLALQESHAGKETIRCNMWFFMKDLSIVVCAHVRYCYISDQRSRRSC